MYIFQMFHLDTRVCVDISVVYRPGFLINLNKENMLFTWVRTCVSLKPMFTSHYFYACQSRNNFHRQSSFTLLKVRTSFVKIFRSPYLITLFSYSKRQESHFKGVHFLNMTCMIIRIMLGYE